MQSRSLAREEKYAVIRAYFRGAQCFNSVKKTLFSLAVPILILNGFFVARASFHPELARVFARAEMPLVSALFVLVFALPSFVALVRWLGADKAIVVLWALGAFAFFTEMLAVKTGFPYGKFAYGPKIGWKIGGVPWTVPFAWTPLLLAAMCLARRWTNALTIEKYARIAACSLILVAIDMVLDPGAVSQKFWRYARPGLFYGVPLSNFFGWILSGAIGALLFDFLTRGQRTLPPTDLLGSAFLILVFWTSVCAFSALWIPTFIGAVLLGVISGYFFQKPKVFL